MAYKQYLGDAVYAEWDGMHVVLTTEDGIEVKARIALDTYVLEALDLYVKRLFKTLEAAADEPPEHDDDRAGRADYEDQGPI